MTLPRLALVAILAATPALADDQDSRLTMTTTEGERPGKIDKWLGDTPHLVMEAVTEGYGFGMYYHDISAVDEITTYEAKRTFVAKEGGAAYAEFELTLEAEIEGVAKEIQLSFSSSDFAAHTLPADFTLACQPYPEGPNAFMAIEFAWEIDGEAIDEEVADWIGFLALQTDEGTPNDLGLKSDGMIGGLIFAARGNDVLLASFTVPVTDASMTE